MLPVCVPKSLQRYCDGQDSVQVPAGTVEDALLELKSGYPDLYKCICDETGAVRQHVNLFVNDSLVAKDSLANFSVTANDSLFVFPSVSGG